MNTRDRCVGKVKAELDAINASLDMFEVRLREANAETQKRLQDEFDRMRAKRDQLSEKLEGMKGSAGQAFDELKSGAERAAAEIRRSFARAREKI